MFLLVFLFLLFTSTIALPPPSRPPFLPHPPPLSPNHTLTNDPQPHCQTHDPRWGSDGVIMEHCTAALNGFWASQVSPSMGQEIEFLGHRARPMYKPMRQVAVTPRKYSIGTCVLTIAMINFYPDTLLPDRGPGPFFDNDVAKFLKVYNVLHDIIFGCKGPGWVGVGDLHGSIGVFVWERFSAMDRRTPSGTIGPGVVGAGGGRG